MAHAQVIKTWAQNTGTANTFSYSGSFDVFLATEVVVVLDEVALTYTADTINESASPREYTVDVAAKTVHIGGANLTSGSITLKPVTNVDSAKATYSAGSSISSGDLNNNQTQVLRKLKEIVGKSLEKAGGTMTGDLTMGEDQTIIFEGSTDNAHETTLTVTDPTADRTITLPNVSGTVVTTGDTGTVTATMIQDAQLSDLADNLTSTAAELNQLDGKTISSGSLSNSATTIPTSSAVNSWVINLLNALGGFAAIANEVSFPNANPDPEDNAGTVVSIGDCGGVVVDSSGVSTTGRTVGGSTVTINGFPSTFQSKTLPAGMGLLVQTTTTLNTYTYHKGILKDGDILAISDTVGSFNQRYRFGANDPTSDNDQGDLFFNTTSNLFKVFDDGNWIKTVPSDADLSNIAIVAGEVGWSDDLGSITDSLTTASGGDINTVADSINDVNRYAEEYKIASSAPSSPSAGDLWYDTSNNQLKVRTSSSWDAIAGAGIAALSTADILDEDNMASNSATKVPSQQSVKAYVDALNWLDQSSKEDGSVIYWKNSSSKYFADDAQNIKTLDGGNF
jgi:hypothetical protein